MNPNRRSHPVGPILPDARSPMIARAIVQLAATLFLAVPASAAPAAVTQTRTVKVVASLPNPGSIAAAVGGDRIDLTVIASGVQDAHFVDPKPSYMVRLRAADLLIVNGLDLEIGWIPPLTQGARNARILAGGPGYVDASSGIAVVEIPSSLSRAEGDVHPYGNPHYLSDPLNAETVAGTIAAALAKADPAGAASYEENRRSFVARLHQALFGRELVDLVGGAKLAREAAAGTLDAFLEGTSVGGAPLAKRLGGWLGTLRPARGRPIITYHRDWSYFARRFGIVVADNVEPKPGIQPSPRHLEDVVARLSQGDVRVIVTRPFVEHRSTDMLAEKTGVAVLTLPLEVGGDPLATDYFALNDLITSRLAAALAGAAPGR